MTVRRVVPVVAIAVVVCGLILAFFTVGTPGRARLVALDRIRVANLYEVAAAMQRRFETANGLPATLPYDLKPDDFGTVGTNGNFTIDPASGAPYEYRRIGPSKYRLCATFALSYRPAQPADQVWKHPSGRTCFEFNVHDTPVDPAANAFNGDVGGAPPF